MPLQKQKLKIPMTAGINDKISELVKGPQTLQELENVDLKTSGEITKRSGFLSVIDIGGADITKIHEYQSELLLANNGVLEKIKKITVGSGAEVTTVGNIQSDFLPEEIINISNSKSVEYFTYHLIRGIDPASDIILYAYIVFESAAAGGTGSLVTGVYDVSKGTFGTTEAVDATINYQAIRGIYSTQNSSFWIASVIDGTPDVMKISFLSLTGAVTAGPTITEEPNGSEPDDYDMLFDSATSSVFLGFREKTSGDQVIKKMDSTGITAAVSNAAISHRNISLDVSGSVLLVSYITNLFVIEVKKHSTSTLALSLTTVLDTLPAPYQQSTNIATVINLGVLQVYFDRIHNNVANVAGLRGIQYCQYNVTTNNPVVRDIFIGSAVLLAAKPFVSNGFIVVPVHLADPSDADTGLFLVQHTPGFSDRNKVLGSFYTGITGEQDGNNKNFYKTIFKPDNFMALIRAEIEDHTATGKPIFRNFAKINNLVSQAVTQFVNFDEYAFISGSFLQQYDGIEIVESNFFHSAFVEAEDKDTLNGHFDDGVVQVKSFLQYTDSKGNTVKSAPSAPHVITFTGGTATQSVIIAVACAAVTNRKISKVELLIFRTELNGSVFHLETSISCDPDGAVQYFMTGLNEDDLIQNEILYTESGEDGNLAVTSTEIIGVFDSRLCCVDKENPNTILYSKPESIDFYQLKIFMNIPKESDDITAIQELDSKLVVFGMEQKFIIVGAGADITGAGNYPPARQLPSEQGTFSPDSIVLTSQGIFFKSSEGIYLLGRGLNTKYIGAPVESFNDLVITSAVSVEQWNEIRFTTSTKTLVYNYALNLWSVNSTPAGFVSATNFRGDYTATDGSEIVKESEAAFDDATTAYDMCFKTAWIQIADITGFQRVWRGTIIGRYIGDHTLNLKIFYDYEAASSESLDFTITGSQKYEVEFLPKRQRCEAMQLEFTFTGNNQNATVNAVEFILGIKGLKNRIPVNRRMV